VNPLAEGTRCVYLRVGTGAAAGIVLGTNSDTNPRQGGRGGDEGHRQIRKSLGGFAKTADVRGTLYSEPEHG